MKLGERYYIGSLQGSAIMIRNAIAPVLRVRKSVKSCLAGAVRKPRMTTCSMTSLWIFLSNPYLLVDPSYEILATSPRSLQVKLILTNGIEINLHGDQTIHLLTEKPFRQVLVQSRSIFHGFTNS